MSDNSFYTPTDLDRLRMENELLAFEVRFLKARLGQSSARSPGSSPSLNRTVYLEEAENDLVMLLRRMSGSPLGRVFRRNKNFRALEQRYLHSREAKSSSASPNRLAYLEGAENDLQLLLRRLGSSPFGPLLRRRGSFRTLEQRYL